MTFKSRPQYLAPSAPPARAGRSVQTQHELAQSMRQVVTVVDDLTDKLRRFENMPAEDRNEASEALGYDGAEVAAAARKIIESVPGAQASKPKAKAKSAPTPKKDN